MNIALYRFTHGSKLLASKFERYWGGAVCCVGISEQSPEFTIYHIYQLYLDNKIDKIVLSSMDSRKVIIREIEELCNIGFDKKDILIASIELMYSENEIEMDQAFIENENFFYMDTLLIPITEHCNLNCKGCSHFSPLVNRESFLDYEMFCKDLLQLKTYIPHTDKINLLGGEPLLHNQLEKFILFARTVYPFAKINIVTNGILVRQMPEHLIQAIRETDSTVLLSVYPIMTKQTGDILNYLLSQDIRFSVMKMSDFTPMLDKEYSEFPAETTELICSNCNMLQNGVLARCPMFLTIEYFNDYFHVQYPYKEAWIDIYDSELTSKKIFEQLNKIYKLCNYCARYKMPYAGMRKWSCYHANENKEMTDWMK